VLLVLGFLLGGVFALSTSCAFLFLVAIHADDTLCRPLGCDPARARCPGIAGSCVRRFPSPAPIADPSSPSNTSRRFGVVYMFCAVGVYV
jgi:hypothetical protein